MANSAKCRIARVCVAFPFHCRHMIRPKHAVKADFGICLHTGKHVGLPFVVEYLYKVICRSAYVSKVDKMDFAALSETRYYRGNVVGHQRKITLAQSGAVCF